MSTSETSVTLQCDLHPSGPQAYWVRGFSPRFPMPTVETIPGDQREGHPGCAALLRGGEQKAWDSLHTHRLTSLHHASFLHSLLNLFEETQMSQIWVQQTCPDQQAEPFLTVSLIHSAPHLAALCLSVSAGRLAPPCLCLPGLFVPHLIPCLGFSCCPAQSCSVPWEADP